MFHRLSLILALLCASALGVLAQVTSVTVSSQNLTVNEPFTATVTAPASGTAIVEDEEVTWDSFEQEWDFGDGETATDLSVTHAYTEEGEYELISFTTFLFEGDAVSFSETVFTMTVSPFMPKRLQVKYRENWSHTPRKVTFREDGFSFSEIVETEKGSYSLTGLVSLEGLATPLGADSAFGLEAGNVAISGTLGELGDALGGTGTFKNGRATAKLQEDIGEERTKLVTIQTLTVSFNAKQLSFRLTGKLHPAEVGDTLDADSYDESGPVELPVILTVGDLVLEVIVSGKATVKVSTKRFKIDGETEEAEAITKTLSGLFNHKAPKR